MDHCKYCNRGEEKESHPHPIVLLPEELRGEIFNKIHRNEALKLRLICKQWDQDIRNYYNFRIKLDERSSFKLRNLFKLQLRIVGLEIGELEQIKIESNPAEGQHPSQILNLKHSKTIRHVKFPDTHYNISFRNLKTILQISSKSAQKLTIFLKPSIMKYRWSSELSYEFQNLAELHLTFIVIGEQYLTAVDPSFLRLLENSQFPNLKNLKATFSKRRFAGFLTPTSGIMFRFLHTILKLVTKNPQGFQQLTLRSEEEVFKNASRPDEINHSSGPVFLPQEQAALRRVSNIRNIDLHFRFPVKGSLNLTVVSDLIVNQRSLENLDLGSYFPLEATLLQSVALNNFDSLKKVVVQALNLSVDMPLDLSVFKNCQKLTTLSLGRNDDFPRISPNDPDLVNVSDLPGSVSFLGFSNLRIESRELLALFNSDLVSKLITLQIVDCGDSGEFGMDFEVFEKIVALEYSAQSPKMSMFLEGFNVSEPDERQKFIEILRGLGVCQSFYSGNFSQLKICFDSDKDVISERVRSFNFNRLSYDG